MPKRHMLVQDGNLVLNRLSSGFKLTLLLLLLPLGLLCMSLPPPGRTHGPGPGFGYHHLTINAIMWIFADRGGRHGGSTVTLRGRSPRHWYWTAPTNYTFTNLEVRWEGEVGKGHGEIDTIAMRLKGTTNLEVITPSSLSQLLLDVPLNTLDKDEKLGIQGIHRMIVDAREGRLPQRQHTYQPDDFVSYPMIQFFRGGRVFPYACLWWVGLWTLLFTYCIWRWFTSPRRAKTGCEEESSPS